MSSPLPMQEKDAQSTGAIADALDKNKQATDDIKDAAEELEVVHAVLDTKLPGDANHGDVADAVARTNELEKRLNKSVEVLEDVNETLAREAQPGKTPGDEQR